MNRQASYAVDHPVAIALTAIATSLRTGSDLLISLADQAEAAGVRPYSEQFDDAARLVGFSYCRSLDLYVDREASLRADQLGYGQAHLALC